MRDILGFTPKVDFNAGVVAAGEAQIESTVIGNNPQLLTTAQEALSDRGQIYLPTNSALTPVGHVAQFLEQLGQGVQHIASRVAFLPQLVGRANAYRAITGEGLTFLSIPRTYYGLLEPALLQRGGVSGELLGSCTEEIGKPEAEEVITALVRAGVCNPDGAVSLDVEAATIASHLTVESPFFRVALKETREMIVRVALRSRYINLWRLLHDALPEPAYLTIVRNQILIDVQGSDVLMQIFTSQVLQRAAGEESFFFEVLYYEYAPPVRPARACTALPTCPAPTSRLPTISIVLPLTRRK